MLKNADFTTEIAASAEIISLIEDFFCIGIKLISVFSVVIKINKRK